MFHRFIIYPDVGGEGCWKTRAEEEKAVRPREGVGEDAGEPITSAPCETYYRGRAGQGLLINLEGADIGFDALETGNIVTVWWM